LGCASFYKRSIKQNMVPRLHATQQQL
jgi:hypothetical protein